MDDGAGAEEHEGLEEGVRREVEHRGTDTGGDDVRVVAVGYRERTEAERGDHVAELGERGVGQDFFDVALDDSAQRGVKRGGGAGPHDDGERVGDHQDVDPAQHINAGGNHRGGVDQGRDGRRAFHRVGEPNLERKLGGFTDSAAEEEERDQRAEDQAVFRGKGVEFGQVDRVVGPVAHHDPEEKTEVADAVGDEGFFRGCGGRGFFVPVVDEQIGAETDQLPKNEHHEKIVGENDAEHRKHENRKTAEVAGFGRVVVHVAEREDMHTDADDTDDAEHEGGEVVELEAERERERAELQPLGRGVETVGVAAEREGEAGDGDGERGGERDRRGQRALPAEKERDDRSGAERREQNDEGEGNGRHGGRRQFFSELS